MKIPFGFYVDVNKILLAHECILDTKSKFDYSSGRGSFGLVFVLDGEADFNFSSSESITVTKGDTLLISDEAAYSIAVKKPFWHYTVNFSIHKKNSIIKLLDTPTGIARLGDTLRFEFIFKRLVST